MKITINKVFQVFQEGASTASISGRAVLPASCEAMIVNDIVTISHPYGNVVITGDRFRELINDETIKIVEN